MYKVNLYVRPGVNLRCLPQSYSTLLVFFFRLWIFIRFIFNCVYGEVPVCVMLRKASCVGSSWNWEPLDVGSLQAHYVLLATEPFPVLVSSLILYYLLVGSGETNMHSTSVGVSSLLPCGF